MNKLLLKYFPIKTLAEGSDWKEKKEGKQWFDCKINKYF